MPEIDFAPENRRFQTVEFDRLKLRKDERARVVLLERPTFAWVHTMKMPKTINGEPVMVEVTRRGEKVQEYDQDFVGRPLCLGDYGIIGEKGLDVDNCPACAKSAEGSEVNPPERRFAVNVIRYKIKGDGSIVNPFSCDSVVWCFGEGVYNKLVEIATEHGTIIGKDLVLGPCVNESWQKYDITPGGQNVYALDERVGNIVKETHENNRSEQLELACGRRQEARWMREDVEKITVRWRQVRGEDRVKGQYDYGTDAKQLTAGLDGLLADSAKPGPADQPTAAMPAQDPAPSAATPANTGGDPVDFESLLAGLNNT